MSRRLVLTIAALALTLAACTTTTTTGASDTLDDVDRPVDLLHDRGAARRALADIEERVGGAPAQVGEITIYPEYMIVEAQDPNILDHIDSYTWRDDSVESPEPVHLSGPQEDIDASLYPTTAVDLSELPNIVRAAEARLKNARPIRVEQARVTYLYIERDTSLDGRVVIHISVTGPRRSGNVVTTASGEILEATVT
jgi:hypothetical protein